jgi:hypothetical protein
MSKALTNMEDFLAQYVPGKNDRFENRLDRYAYLNKAIEYANSGQVVQESVINEYQQHGWDDARAIKYPLIDNHVTTINTGKLATCEASVTEIDTAFGTMTTIFYNWELTMKLADSYTNEVKYLEEFMTKYNSGIRAWADLLDTLVATNVEAVANTYFPAEVTAYWPANIAGDAFLIPQAETSTMYNYMEGVMREMNWDTQSDRYDVITSSKHFGRVRDLSEQGQSNDTNTKYQFDPNSPYMFTPSTKIPLGEAVDGEAAMIMLPNTFGLWNVNAPDVIANSSTGDGKDWTTITDPMTGWDIGALYSSKCINAESLESYQYYTGVSFLSTYNSDPATRFNPFIKAEIGA